MRGAGRGFADALAGSTERSYGFASCPPRLVFCAGARPTPERRSRDLEEAPLMDDAAVDAARIAAKALLFSLDDEGEWVGRCVENGRTGLTNIVGMLVVANRPEVKVRRLADEVMKLNVR